MEYIGTRYLNALTWTLGLEVIALRVLAVEVLILSSELTILNLVAEIFCT